MAATSLDLSQIKTDALSSGDTFRSLIGLGDNDSAAFSSVDLTGGTVTTSTPLLDATQTWNSAGTVFTGLKLNVTDTASNASSLLMDLQVGGSSKFKVSNIGNAYVSQYLYFMVGGTTAIKGTSGAYGSGVSLVANGKEAVNCHSTFVAVRSDTQFGFLPSTSGYAVPDVQLNRDAADTLAQRRGTNPQTFRLYNTYTDASNYERGFLKWNSYESTGTVFEIGSERSGTGATRGVMLNPSNGFIYTNGTIKAYNYHQNQTIQANSGSSLLLCGATNSHQAAKFELLGGQGAVNWSLGTSIIKAGSAYPTGSVIVGADLDISGGNGGSSSTGDAHGGNVIISGGTGYGTGHDGYVILGNLPTSDPGVTGALWNDLGTLRIS